MYSLTCIVLAVSLMYYMFTISKVIIMHITLHYSPVLQSHLRDMLKLMLGNLGLDSDNYGVHSLRIGRTTDLAKFNYSIEEIHRMGHWWSNVVYKYIKQ